MVLASAILARLEIAKRTGLSRNTVCRWLKTAEEVKVPTYMRRAEAGAVSRNSTPGSVSGAGLFGVEAVALEWHGKQVSNWSPEHAKRTLRQLERDLFPWLGSRLMDEIEPMELLAVLQKIEERGAVETADRALMLARQVYEY